MKVSDILRVKGNTLYTASPDEPLSRAIDLMAEKDIGSLVVMHHGDERCEHTFIANEPSFTSGAARRQRATFVDDDPVHPGAKPLRISARREIPEGTHERGLERVIGVVDAAEHAGGKTGKCIAVTSHENAECIDVT